MKTKSTDEVLERIAREHLFLDTLKPQGRDALDFHDMHVGTLRAALLAAYNAGRQSIDAPVVVREATEPEAGVPIPPPPVGFRRGRR